MIEPKDPSDRVSACAEDREALRDLVASLPSPICVEVGAYVGHTARAMIEGGASHVYSVDLWSGDLAEGEGWRWKIDAELGRRLLEEFCHRVPLLDRVTPLVGDSRWWAARWPFAVDLVFIDAEHSYASCAADIAAWWPHVRPSGILCGHDYGMNCPGVTRAVEESGPFEIVGKTVWWRRHS